MHFKLIIVLIEDSKTEGRKIIQNAQGEALKIEEDINRLHGQRAQLRAALLATLEMHRRLLEPSPDPGKSPAGSDEG